MDYDKLFNNVFSSASLDTLKKDAESHNNVQAWKKDKERFFPTVDYSKPENFAKYGSAEEYYRNAIERIRRSYPYDGSSYEKLEWHNSSSYLDNYIFEKEYPRTNGYITFSPHDSDGLGWGTLTDTFNGYGAPATSSYEYVLIKGGPHTSTRKEGKDISDTSGDYKDGYANYFDLGRGRDSNLRIDGVKGNTVEFWMKKDQFLMGSSSTSPARGGDDVHYKTNKEVVFDLYVTGTTSVEDYARMRIELTGGLGYNDSPFYVTYMSGASGINNERVGKYLTMDKVADDLWHHYAFSFKNTTAGKSILFDGTNDYVSLGPVDFNPWDDEDEFTVSLWFRRDSAPSSTETLLENVYDHSGADISIFGLFLDSSGRINYRLGTSTQHIASTNYCDGEWHHVTLVVYQDSGAKFKVYVDNTLVKGATPVPGSYGTPNSFWFGRASGGLYYGGYLDEVTLWNTDLSATEVSELYNDGQYFDPTRHSKEANLLSWWDMGETISDATTAAPNYKIVDRAGTNSGIMTGFDTTYGIKEVSNFGTRLETKVYVNGTCEDTLIFGNSIGYVSGAMIAAIGSLATSPSGSENVTSILPHTPDRQDVGLGWGKLSASLDEFRFWKSRRDSKEIGRNWFTQVHGGTNTDGANLDLGVYYKFNEGITLTSSADSTILDYSGRISNGSWTGYRSVARSTGSAITESSASLKEFKDPILYVTHPDVARYNNRKRLKGIEYDFRNAGSLVHKLPAWIIEEDEYKGSLETKHLTQILASYFDTLFLQVEGLNKIKDKSYASGSILKPQPFNKHLLQTQGMVSPELFVDATVLEAVMQQNHELKFDDKLHNLKNLIYKNIYNNLIYIYKSKGTEKSFRNLIRCFGVDDELIKLNIYSHNTTYELKENNYRDSMARKVYVDFYDSDRYESTVFQMTSSGNQNSTSFISGAFDSGSAITYETEVLFPKKARINQDLYRPFNHFSASLFGTHMVNSTVGAEDDTSWNAVDYANFQVYSARRTLKEDVIDGLGYTNRDAFFVLTSSNESLAFELTTPIFRNVYDSKKWNFAVRVIPENHPQSYKLGSTHFTNKDYKVEFYGVNYQAGVLVDHFYETASIASAKGSSFVTGSKRLYIGAHRTNFTGSLLAPTDVRISSTRVWADYLSNGVINAHARDATNFGTENVYWHAFPGQTELDNNYIPQMETLALHWDFNQVTGSDSTGNFIVEDMSSGSQQLEKRYGKLGHIVKKQHTGLGFSFPTNDTVITREFVQTSKQNLPENVNSNDMTRILTTEDDIVFTRESRPISNYFAFEKSMNQIISEDIINLFATIKDFNNLIGETVNRYRQDYKDMSKLRQLFFERIQNVPKLTKFVDYYKWIDSSVGVFLEQLVPASAEFGQGIKNVIESHVLERNKYHNKFPTLETALKDPEAHLFAINELLYNWKFGHAPISGDESDSCLWWKDRAERHDTRISSDDSNVDEERNILLEQFTKKTVSGSTYAIRQFTTPYKHSVSKNKVIHGGVNFSENKKVDFYKTALKINDIPGSGSNLAFRIEEHKHNNDGTQSGVSASIFGDIYNFKDCDDDLELRYTASAASVRKRKLDFQLTDISTLSLDSPLGHGEQSTKFDYSYGKGDLLAPFNMMSSSNEDMYNLLGTPYVEFVNLHHDSYGPDFDTPMQGPFTEKFVGGNQHRHYWNNFSASLRAGFETNPGPVHDTQRPEAWKLARYKFDGIGHNIYFMHPRNAFGTSSFDKEYDGNDELAPFHINSASAVAPYYRDFVAKRPVNIKNILQHTGTSDMGFYTVIGNYSKDYEIVQTVGRTTNNRFLVNPGWGPLSASLDNVVNQSSTLVEKIVDYQLPDRTFTSSVDGHVLKNIFVNKFAGMQGPEVSSRGALNFESEEYSVYNALPWRNLTVRKQLNTWLSDHTKQFGYNSDTAYSASWDRGISDWGQTGQNQYPGSYQDASLTGSVSSFFEYVGNNGDYVATASYHKTHRNTLDRVIFASNLSHYRTADDGVGTLFITKSVHDNWFVQHQIPRSDMQYAWITASAIGTIFGYETPDHSLASNASTDIQFCSASELGSYDTTSGWAGPAARTSPFTWATRDSIFSTANKMGFIFTDFAGLSINIAEPINIDKNRAGFPQEMADPIEAAALYTLRGSSVQGLDKNVPLWNFYGSSTALQGETFPGYMNDFWAFMGDPPDASPEYNYIYAGAFNALMLHRNGPYGYPSWKQTRTCDHPVARFQRNNNFYSLPEYTLQTKVGDQYTDQNKVIAFNKFVVTKDLPVTSKFLPMSHMFQNGAIEIDDLITIEHTYGNNLTYFTHDTLNFEPSVQETMNTVKPQMFDDLKGLYGITWNKTGLPPKVVFKNFEYREIIFPKKMNAYSSGSRKRLDYLEGPKFAGDNPTRKLKTLGDARESCRTWNPGVTATKNNRDRRTFSIHQEKGIYKPIRTFWRDDIDDRIRTEKVARNSLGIIQDADILSGSTPENPGNLPFGWISRAATSSAGLSVWPLDSQCAWHNTPDFSPRDLFGMPSTSSVSLAYANTNNKDDIYLYNGELCVHSIPYQFKTAIRHGSADAVAISASMMYEFPQEVVVSGSQTGKSSGRIKTWGFVPRWRTSELAPPHIDHNGCNITRNPWHDTYEKYSEDISTIGKDYSIIPEYRVSEHLDEYLSDPLGFQVAFDKFLTLDGAHIMSGNIKELNDPLMERFSNTEEFEHLKSIREDHIKKNIRPKNLTLSCKGIKKLLPYNGFYPVLRTVQLGAMFSQSFGPNLSGSMHASISGLGGTFKMGAAAGPEWLQSIMQPFFAPGIMFNTIKSGLACDWPIYTGSATAHGHNSAEDTTYGLYSFIRDRSPDYRMPFEALLNPENYILPAKTIGVDDYERDESIMMTYPFCFNSDIVPGGEHSAGGIDSGPPYATWNGVSDQRYNLAMHNFIAEVPKFFLEKGELNTFVSKPVGKTDFSFKKDTTYYMDVNVYKSDDVVMYEGPSKWSTIKDGEPNDETEGGEQSANNEHASFGVRGIHYGMPMKVRNSMDGTHDAYAVGGEVSGSVYSHMHSGNLSDPAYAAYTPPYFYGRSVARIAYTPPDSKFVDNDSGVYSPSLETFLAELKGMTDGVTYFNLGDQTNGELISNAYNSTDATSALSELTGALAKANAMAISASVNLFGRATLPTQVYNAITGDVETLQDANDAELHQVWTIGTKFETPVLNFSGNFDSAITAKDNDAVFNSGPEIPVEAVGMWKGYGELLEENKGVFISLAESFSPNQYTSGGSKASLLQKCFPTSIPKNSNNKKKIGRIADQKEIREAVVMVPYFQKGGKKEFIELIRPPYVHPTMGDYGGFTYGQYRQALRDYATKGKTIKAVGKYSFGQSVIDMAMAFGNYVMPPQFDWLTYDIHPLSMYIFEFKHTLRKEDLSYIWQNVMPDIAMSAEMVPGRGPDPHNEENVQPTISHPLYTVQDLPVEIDTWMPFEILRGDEVTEDLKWMVFKVKQKAATNYFDLTLDQTDDKTFMFDFAVGGKKQEIKYNYNWPYDFFSLVELAKVEANISFGKQIIPKSTGFGKEIADELGEVTGTKKRPSDPDVQEKMREAEQAAQDASLQEKTHKMRQEGLDKKTDTTPTEQTNTQKIDANVAKVVDQNSGTGIDGNQYSDQSNNAGTNTNGTGYVDVDKVIGQLPGDGTGTI